MTRPTRSRPQSATPPIGLDQIGTSEAYEALVFCISIFERGETFEVDCDTDGLAGNGPTMAGATVISTTDNSGTFTGVLANHPAPAGTPCSFTTFGGAPAFRELRNGPATSVVAGPMAIEGFSNRVS